jgi:hypothetical protein
MTQWRFIKIGSKNKQKYFCLPPGRIKKVEEDASIDKQSKSPRTEAAQFHGAPLSAGHPQRHGDHLQAYFQKEGNDQLP